jgi:phosphoglycolate phosphatase
VSGDRRGPGGGPLVQLVCLDLAGTTVADDGAVERAFDAALAAVGVGPRHPERPRLAAYVRRTMGMSKVEVFRAIFDDEAEAQAANRAFESTFERLIRGGALRPLPGARAAIETLRSHRIRVALTTGFSVDTRRLLLEALGWEDLADLALSPADAGRGRPFPDMVLTALLRLEVDSVAAVAVAGDTEADMIAGRRAGASVVAGVLTGSDDRERLVRGGATDVLDSVAELPALLGLG